jgi:2,4-dienoyl-CoA reductase-like NADH-dependent reductase (Old Yellow Enzyme family)
VVGVKLNAGDYVHGGFSEDHSLEHIKTVSSWNMVDFIEVSGGDYEDPRMLGTSLLSELRNAYSRLV